MNIFVVSTDPVVAAQMLCDEHVVKMPLESAQMLSTAFEPGMAPYRRTHYNHPCAVWTRTSEANYRWLLAHAQALSEEYTFRYGKKHKSGEVVAWCANHIQLLAFPVKERTPFAIAMDDRYKVNEDPVASYRNFYVLDKSRFAHWEHGRRPPSWYLERLG
ncbi:MAG: pyrimidine dimer DNA glycosylase/endonuclease V [Anaerolineae bacterium]